MFFLEKKRAFATSSYSYNIAWPFTTNPHVYITQGYIVINSSKILFHVSITKSQLHNQCLACSTRYIQKEHMLPVFTPFSPPINWYSSMNEQQSKIDNFPNHFYAPQLFGNCLSSCGKSPFRLWKPFASISFHDLAHNSFLPIFAQYWKKRHLFILFLCVVINRVIAD